MAVGRRTFIWKGNDRAYRHYQEFRTLPSDGTDIGVPDTGPNAGQGGVTLSVNDAAYGATSGHGFIKVFGLEEGNSDILRVSGSETGGQFQKVILDQYWNNPDNWVERLPGVPDGVSGEGDPDGFYYVRPGRIPHRGDKVLFTFVRGTTGNGLTRGQHNDTGVSGNNDKPFNIPLSPCSFGGRVENEWVGATSAGNSAQNRSGPLTEVVIDPSYFFFEFGVNEGAFMGVSPNISAQSQINGGYGSKFGNPHPLFENWGKLLFGEIEIGSNPSLFPKVGASFDNIAWGHSGSTGVNGLAIAAVKFVANTPYRFTAISGSTLANEAGIPSSIHNGVVGAGKNIVPFGGANSPNCQVILDEAENIFNMSVGANYFKCLGGTAVNLAIDDMYAFNATDDTRKRIADTVGSVEYSPLTGVTFPDGTPELNTFYYRGSVSNVLRCDPCWFQGNTIFTEKLGSPATILWGPYFSYGSFQPTVKQVGEVRAYPQQISSSFLTVDQIEEGDTGETSKGSSGGNAGRSRPTTGRFGSFSMVGATGIDDFPPFGDGARFGITTCQLFEFNPRWDVITSAGASGTKAIDANGIEISKRGFNNKLFLQHGCTIANLKVDAGQLAIGENHPGGSTFDDEHEISDVTISAGYAEQKSLISGEHPTISDFNAFFIGDNGINESGGDFQIRSNKAEFEFGQGVFLRSGPVVAGVTTGAFAFQTGPKSMRP